MLKPTPSLKRSNAVLTLGPSVRGILVWEGRDNSWVLNINRTLAFGDLWQFVQSSAKYVFPMTGRSFVSRALETPTVLKIHDDDEWVSSSLYFRVGIAARDNVRVSNVLRRGNIVYEVIPTTVIAHEDIYRILDWFSQVP